MKILVYYTPRSKSTAVHNALAEYYNLEPFGDRITKSRIRNKSFVEYPDLIGQINSSDNICVKLNGNDFIDLPNRQISDLYKTIDFRSFNKIVFVTRSDLTEAIASYAYMDPTNESSWHRRRGQTRVGESFTIPVQKAFYLMRGYAVYDIVRDYIKSTTITQSVFNYEYSLVESCLKHDFGVTTEAIDIEPNNFDYSTMATNYHYIKSIVPDIVKQINSGNPDLFWKDELQ